MSFLGRLLGRPELPPGFTTHLAADEHVIASAALTGGGHVVATSLGLWVDGPRRIGWDLVSKATWGNGAIALVEARIVDGGDTGNGGGGAVLIEDLPVVRLRLAEPGRVPQTVHERVEASIRSRHHRDLPGGGAWFVQRKVPGRDGVVLQVRPDPGTDEAAARQVAADAAAKLGLSR